MTGVQDTRPFNGTDGPAVPACGYQTHDMIDDDITELSGLVTNPSAEGFVSEVQHHTIG